MTDREPDKQTAPSADVAKGYVLGPQPSGSVWERHDERLTLRSFEQMGDLTRRLAESGADVVFLTRNALDAIPAGEAHAVDTVRAISDAGIVLEGDYPVGSKLPGDCDAVVAPDPSFADLVVAADAAIRRARSRRLGAHDRAFVQSLLESNHTLMLSFDPNLEIREFNRACEETTGLAFRDVVDSSFDEIVEDDLDDLVELLTRNRGRIFPTSRAFTFRGVDGPRVVECSLSPFFDEKGAVRLILLTGVDVTEQRAFESALRESEEAFRTLVESSPDSICVFSVKDNDWLYANPAALELLGVQEFEELREHGIFELMAPQDVRATKERLARIVETGMPSIATEVSMSKVDGTPLSIESVEIPLRYRGVPSILTISRDQTERKELTARMMQLDRMVAVGTLAAGVGHEINNPLAYLTSNVEYAAEEVERVASKNEELDSLKEVALALDEALDGAFRVRDIVRDLKDLSRAEDDITLPIDLETVVESALNIASHEIRTRATVRRDFVSVPLVHGSGSRVRRLLINVLLNAAQAIPEGNPGEHEIWIRMRELPNGRVGLTIEDDGVGIPHDDLKRVFDPFFTTKSVGTGTGLGLTIAQRIIESIGGSIAIESEVGQGTTISIEFEAIDGDAQAEDDLPSPSRQIPIRVLVLDDEPMIGNSVRRALTEDSEVIDFQTGEDALNLLKTDQDFDAILCDVVMPEMSGQEFYRAICDDHPELARRVVFMTGGAFTEGAARFQVEHSDRFMEKPFAAWELREKLYEIASSS